MALGCRGVFSSGCYGGRPRQGCRSPTDACTSHAHFYVRPSTRLRLQRCLWASLPPGLLLQDLQQLTGLQVLGLSNCYEVTGGGVLALAEHATGLRRLELYNCEVLDEHLEGFSRVSSAARGAQHQHHWRGSASAPRAAME